MNLLTSWPVFLARAAHRFQHGATYARRSIRGNSLASRFLNAVPRGRAVKSANKESRLVAARPAVFSAKDN
jgi:hypothetical protein